MHQSIATIDSPEFINLQPLDINPLMSSCEIKVLYLGENRNRSYISKEVATEMAKTLRGAPIVGYFNENKDDFSDHGERVILDDEGVKFECLTKPYGFVAPDAQVWFQKFEDTDDFGNKIEREYLMTTGYLWTEQFQEAQVVIDEGRPQSMELDGNSLDGHWSTNQKTGIDFFIINDAIFSKICILGTDVEPCFEGASVTSPDVSSNFSLVSDDFKKTLYTMMQELKFALEGGQGNMEEIKEDVTENVEEIVDNIEESAMEENQESTEAQSTPEVQEDDVQPTEEEVIDDAEGEETPDSEEIPAAAEKDDEEEVSLEDKYSLLEQQYNELNTKYAELEAFNESLVSFKQAVEDKQKDELINSFYMLSDEDKKDVIENKSKYSLADIEAKLSVICVRKRVNFSIGEDKDDDASKDTDKEAGDAVTFTLEEEKSSVPAWISALRNTKKIKNNNLNKEDT